ncbi:hypothetical protein BYT27DRAFT_7099450 [Phlegmacium glaucopus]|nr:hypothetical protein BYT27DRAFT_7099450 [Phlegmacium glaucopus]
MKKIMSNSFISLANIRLPSPSRLFENACCPDKDLVVLFSRLGGADRMSLWNSNQGSRLWEADVGTNNTSSHVVGIAWSPDGQSIAVIRDPPAISLHSLQDGHSFLSLPINLPENNSEQGFHLTGIWWFRDEKNAANSSTIPDIFQRNNIITGSAHSILRCLPLLDNFQEESEKLTATDLFAFQGSQTRPSLKAQFPPIIREWPTLSVDLVAASINVSSHTKPTSESLDEVDSSNLNSIVLVTDNLGHVFGYLDGTFPFGLISLGSHARFKSMVKHPSRPYFLGHVQTNEETGTFLRPAFIDIPLLSQRKSRDLAKLSSTARELVWYMMRVVKEMRSVWYGSENNTGARELGPKWVLALETKQKEQFGQIEPNPILDLTSLLTTGRASESLLDFLGSGEQMSERGIQKWESTVSESLIKLRDFAEKRVAPACQRLHLVMEEIQGWAKLPQYFPFQLRSDEVTVCLELADRGVLIASWLAAVCRTELSHFREFILWLRFEINYVNSPNDGNIPRHDILEVNNYFINGLCNSSIDQWFIGPVPQFQPVDLGILEHGNGSIADILEQARTVVNDPSQMTWQINIPRKDLSHLDRNLDALIEELSKRCQRVFRHAAGAPSRCAVVSFDCRLHTERLPEEERPTESSLGFPFRERTIANEQSGEFLQHLAMHIPSEHNKLLLTQLRFGIEASELPSEIGIVLLEYYLPEEYLAGEGQEESQLDLELLDADFFDDECVVIIYRLRKREKQCFIATVSYKDVGYKNLGYVKSPAREDLMQNALALWKNGDLATTKIAIKRSRVLSSCKEGGNSVALNGRKGRRVGCVLDSSGTMLESIDLEGDGEDMEVADGARAG